MFKKTFTIDFCPSQHQSLASSVRSPAASMILDIDTEKEITRVIRDFSVTKLQRIESCVYLASEKFVNEAHMRPLPLQCINLSSSLRNFSSSLNISKYSSKILVKVTYYSRKTIAPFQSASIKNKKFSFMDFFKRMTVSFWNLLVLWVMVRYTCIKNLTMISIFDDELRSFIWK